MKLTTRTKYGLKMCFLIAQSGEPVPLSSLQKQTQHSEKYLEQLLALLKKGGVLKAERGVNGGYRLARPAAAITMKEILDALGDGLDLSDCTDGVCKDTNCPNKQFFARLSDSVNKMLSSFSLQDMVNEVIKDRHE